MNSYRGVSGQGIDAYMVELFGSGYTERLSGTWYGTPYSLAYVTAKIPVAEFTAGWPTLKAKVRGWRCFDPRTGFTAFTRNPALHYATAIASPLVGLKKPVNLDSVIDAANRCDDLFPDGPRIQCNIEIGGAPVPTMQWMETLRGYAGVILDWRDGEYHFLTDGPRMPDWHIAFSDPDSDAEMVDLPEIDLTSVTARKNVIRVKYTDTSVSPWKEVVEVVESVGVQASLELEVVQEYRMPGLLTRSQALRYGQERLAEHQLEKWVSTVPVADEGAAVRVGHVATLRSPNGLNNEPGRVLGKQNPSVGLWLLRCRHYDPNAYLEP
ncbi:MAG: phage tail protein [Halioglobus sp.]